MLYVRPDLKFIDAVNVTQVLSLGENDFLTPYWHQWSGLNDRIAAGRPRAAAAFADRIDYAMAYARGTFLRSESFLKWVMCDTHRFDLAFLEAKAQRVRANGDVADNDRCLQYCSLALKRTCRADCRKLVPEGEAPPLPEWARKQQARDRQARDRPRKQTASDQQPPKKRQHHTHLP